MFNSIDVQFVLYVIDCCLVLVDGWDIVIQLCVLVCVIVVGKIYELNFSNGCIFWVINYMYEFVEFRGQFLDYVDLIYLFEVCVKLYICQWYQICFFVYGWFYMVYIFLNIFGIIVYIF